MQRRVLQFMKEHHMIEKGDKVIIGVSGGADSVCLLHILYHLSKELEFQVAVVHINHNLRGQEALRDEAFVDKLCKTYDLPYKTYSVDVNYIASKEKVGIEEAGRKVRYNAFSDFARQWGANKIALAHHQNDVAETMLYHLARGTKIAGLCSIKPVRDHYIRPLLCMNRKEIEHYLKEYHINYVTDSSNLTKHYTRNKIRHDVLNYMEKEINPQVVSHMASVSNHMLEVEQYLIEQARRQYKTYVNRRECGLELSDGILKEHKVIILYVIRLCIEDLRDDLKNITQTHLEAIYELYFKNVGKSISLPNQMWAKRLYNGVLLGNVVECEEEKGESVTKELVPLKVPGSAIIEECVVTTKLIEEKLERIPEKIYTKWLDYDKIEGNLVLRTRKSGDYLVINQQGGTKKLKDFFIHEKIPKEERDHIWLLARESEILWVVGYRISEAYKVSAETKEIINIQLSGGKYCER